MAVIGSLSVKLGLVTVEWDQATQKAKQQAKQLQSAFNDLKGDIDKLAGAWKTLGGSIGVGTIGLTALIAQTADFADRIGDLAKAFGITTGFALQFNNALIQAGSSGEQATKIITKLFENLDQAQHGNQAAVDQFRALGISFAEIKALKPEEAIRRVFEELSKIEDPIRRVDLMRKTFGKGGLGLDVQEVNALLQGGVANWQKYGEQLEKVAKVKDNLQTSLNNLMIAFSQFIGPLTRDGTVSVEKFTGALIGLGVYLSATKLIAVATAFAAIVTEIKAATTATVALNLAMSGSGVGLLVKLGAASIGYLSYLAASGQKTGPGISSNPMGDTFPDMGQGLSPGSAAGAGRGFVNPSNVVPRRTEEFTPLEVAAQMAVTAERIKTVNAEMALGIPLYATYTRTLFNISREEQEALNQIKVKQLQVNEQFKDSADLRRLETGKLQEQAKQIRINADLKRNEANYNQRLLEDETERVRQAGYLAGAVRNQEEQQSRLLATNKALLDVQKQQIDYASEFYQLSIKGFAPMGAFAKDVAMQGITHRATIEKLQAELQSLPDYVTALPGEELSKETEANNRRIDSIKAQIDFEQKRHDLRMSNMQSERTFEYGMQQAIANYVENASNMAQKAQDMFSAVTNNMDRALQNFVRTGKLSFKELVASILQDLLLIQMRAAATPIFSSIFASILGRGTGLNAVGATGGANYLAPYADGGQPTVNQPALVGERGPEIFVPHTSGTIIPNSALKGMGNVTNVTNYNIQAIDVKSFEDRLYQSSRAVWAANSYANKSLAVQTGRM